MECEIMDEKVLGWNEITIGVLLLLGAGCANNVHPVGFTKV